MPPASSTSERALPSGGSEERDSTVDLTPRPDVESCSPWWDEADRLAALERYAILDSGREDAFDDVAELAADILDAPIAVVNFIAEHRQWFKAEVGVGTDTLPLDVSICRHAILQSGILVVPDLTQDKRFESNPLVHVADGLRFYAGALLKTPEGLPLGTVCVFDRKSRPQGISDRQKRALAVLANQTMTRLELRRSEAIARTERARAEKHARRLSIVAQASTFLLAADDLVDTVRAVFALVADEFRLDMAFHYRCGDGALRLVAAAGLSPEQEEAAARIEFGETVCGIVAVRREAMHVTDIQASGAAHAVVLKKFGLDTYFSAPLLSGSDLLGTVSFGRRGDSFSIGELEALSTLAAQLATAIERGYAEEALRESEARQAFLLSLSDALRSLKTPSEIALMAVERLGERYELNRVFYAEYFGTVMKVEHDFTRDVESIVGEHDLAAFGPELLQAYHDCPVVKVEDVRTDPRFNEDARAGLRARKVGAYLDVVLFENERWVSLLALQSTAPRAWTATEEGLFREVGERVRVAIDRACAEDRLVELNETLEQRVAERTAERDRIWNTSPDLMLVIDFEGYLRQVNPGWTALLGYEPHELVNHHVKEFVVPQDHAQTVDAYGLAARGGRPTVENRYRHKDGSTRWISWVAAPADGLTYATGRDITAAKEQQAELEAAQEALRQSQKMEAMGQLTGGVAHDFNNLLTPIVGGLDMLQRKGLGGEREQRLIAGAMQSAERAKTLVQRLLAFARRQPLQAVSVDVAKLVAGMGDLIASTTGPQIKILIEVPKNLPGANADPNQLEMALLNLAVNARDAMADGGGTLRLSAWAESVARGHRSELATGTYVCLSVADTGAGMDEVTLARAIEPFFSTKGVGKGTGLGLSMVHGLATQLGGALTIDSRPGFGTNVELWLPVSEAVAEQVDGASTSPELAQARGTVLLVDDEELVRLSTADMLSDLGYVVLEASSAEEALRLINNGERFDLLVTDHLMPGMDGTDLAREVQSTKPSVPVLLVSGFAEREGVDPDLPRLTKPFRRDELALSLLQLKTAG